jgi:hypothetical protein
MSPATVSEDQRNVLTHAIAQQLSEMWKRIFDRGSVSDAG